MARLVNLEDFGERTPSMAHADSAVLTEEQRLEAFEKGYRDGWDDAVASQTEEEGRITVEFAANLRDLAFTYHEARMEILKGVEPLLRELVARVLPEIAKATLPELVAERLQVALDTAAERPILLTVAPATRPALERILPADPGFPLRIVEEATLAEGQVYVGAGSYEERVDLTAALQEISGLIEDFFAISEPRVANA